MATTRFSRVIEQIHKMASGQRPPEPTDRQLLEQFSATRDHQAFAMLVTRHGPMVLRVCRRVLNHTQDAEDAFQAAFLVLASHVESIRKREALAEWLHGVAYRTAMKARRTAARRRHHEAALQLQAAPPANRLVRDDVKAVLDEEIQRLPRDFRAAFVVCVLEGKTGRQAASELGVPSGTVSSRLTSARQRLRQRLSRRGIELTVLLAALSVAECSNGALPACLASEKVFKCWIAAASGQAGQPISPQVATLAAQVSRTMLLTKTKLMLGILVAAAALAVGGAKMRPTMAVPETPQIPRPALVADKPAALQNKPPQAAATDPTPNQVQIYAGRVLDPDGKPAAGAKVYLLYYTAKKLPVPVRAVSDREGRFRFEVAKASFDKSAATEPWYEAILVARADGYGPGLPNLGAKGQLAAYAARKLGMAGETIHLTKDDVPITGRILDLEGKPCQGVAVSVQGLHAPQSGDLAAFLHDVKETKALFPPMRKYLLGFENWIGRDLGTTFPTAVTGNDGRFVLHGIGRERLVQLSLDGPTVTTTQVLAVTRVGAPVEAASGLTMISGDQLTVIRASSFEVVLPPSKPIVGLIMDKDTKRPLAGAVVTGTHPQQTSKMVFGPSLINVTTVADQQGRFKLTGLPKLSGNVVTVGPPPGQPYLLSERRLNDTPGLDPLTVDFSLKRGIWITGRVFDKISGKPVHAEIIYAPFEDNGYQTEALGLAYDRDTRTQADTGTFRLVGFPGHGLIGVRAFDSRYPRTDGKQIKGQRIPMTPGNYSGLAEIDPAREDAAFTVNIPLEVGGKLTGTVLDPEGKPLAGVLVSGIRDIRFWEHAPLPTAEFVLINMASGKPRLVEFAHRDKGLAGFLVVKGDEKSPLTVRLVRAGSIKARLINKEGNQVVKGEVVAMQEPMSSPGVTPFDPTRGTLPRNITPDKDGVVHIQGLAPGLKYELALVRGGYLFPLEGKGSSIISVQAGETIDLGDVVVKNLGD